MSSLLPSKICNKSHIFLETSNDINVILFCRTFYRRNQFKLLKRKVLLYLFNGWLSIGKCTAEFILKEARLFFWIRIELSFSNWILSPCAKIYNYAELFVGRAGFRPARKSADEANLLDFQTFSPVQGVLTNCQFWFLEKRWEVSVL